MTNLHDYMKESDLAGLLNDPKIRDCYACWDDVGLEIGFIQSDLDVIARENHRVADCMKAMLIRLVRNNSDGLSLNDLHQAIRKVNERNRRKRHRDEAFKEEETVEIVVNQLERLLDDWEFRNKSIAEDLEMLIATIKEEESWILCKKVDWENKTNEWKKGETARRKKKIQESLARGNFKESSKVHELLKNRDLALSQLSERAIESILRKDLADIDLDQSHTLELQYKQMKKHSRQLKLLNDEISDSKNLLDERTRAYNKIKSGLRNIGVKKENLDLLNEQLQSLKVTVDECQEIKKHCDEVFEAEKNSLDQWTGEVKVFIDSFDDSVKKMQETELQFTSMNNIAIRLVGGTILIVILGIVIGTIVFPGVGLAAFAAIGTTIYIGITAGLLWSIATGDEKRAKVESKVRSFKETISRARTTHSNLQELIGKIK